MRRNVSGGVVVVGVVVVGIGIGIGIGSGDDERKMLLRHGGRSRRCQYCM